MMLGLALAAVSGCSTDSSRTSDAPGAGVKMNVVFPSGVTINSLNYSVTCGSFTKTGAANTTNSDTLSFAVGGMADGADCSVTVSGSDSTSPSTPNCTAALAHITAHNANTRPSTANLSLVCTDNGINKPALVGGITGLAQVVVNGITRTCASITDYVVNPDEVTIGNSIQLTADLTNAKMSDGSSPSGATGMVFTDTSPANSNVLSATSGSGLAYSASYKCNQAGTFTLQIAATDNYVSPAGQACGSNTATFQVVCDQPATAAYATSTSLPGAGGSGGSTGGTNATGGTTQATGGTSATGGSATGGTSATGGSATGGAPTDPVAAIVAAYAPGQTGSTNCNPGCAASCESSWPCTTSACQAVLQCIMPANEFSTAGGSCYDFAGTDTATPCFCGNSTDCSSSATGVCASQETAGGLTPASVFTMFTSTTIPAGLANGLVNCLSDACNCFPND